MLTHYLSYINQKPSYLLCTPLLEGNKLESLFSFSTQFEHQHKNVDNYRIYTCVYLVSIIFPRNDEDPYFWSLTEYFSAHKEHELINRKQNIYRQNANPVSKHDFRALADNAEPLCLMSLKQLFDSKNSLMVCYLLPPLKTFSLPPDMEMTY